MRSEECVAIVSVCAALATIAFLSCDQCLHKAHTPQHIHHVHTSSSYDNKNNTKNTEHIAVSAHASATTSAHSTTTIIRPSTTQTVSIALLNPINISAEVDACNKIRLHMICCEVALSKEHVGKPMPSDCHALYATYHGQRHDYSSASSSAYHEYNSGSKSVHGNMEYLHKFEPCNITKNTQRMCCKACTPSCMACAWGIPETAYRLCYKRHLNGCHPKCNDGLNLNSHISGLCPLYKNI